MAMFEEKKFTKMMSKVPEIKLVKLIIALSQKNTLFNRYCVDQPLLLIPENQLRYNKIQLIYIDYLVVAEREKTS